MCNRSKLFWHQKSSHGFTLIEAAVMLVVLILALVPVINFIGGPRSNDGNLTRTTGHQTKEIVFANSMMERALAGDFSAITCENGMNLPGKGITDNCDGTNTTYNKEIYYEWVVANKADTIPDTMQNTLYDATLNVCRNNECDGSNTILTFPTKVFENNFLEEEVESPTNIVIVLDTSGSMGDAKSGSGTRPLPYLFDDGSSAFGTRKVDNNNELDLAIASASNDLDTPYRDDWPAPNIAPIGGACLGDAYLSNTALPEKWEALCNKTGANYTDQNLSRLEASRSSLLKFLLTVENDPNFYDNIRLGFVSFDTTPHFRFPNSAIGNLETHDGTGRFVQMRRHFASLNRTDSPYFIQPDGWTDIAGGIDNAIQLLDHYDQDGDKNIIFLVGDGIPTADTVFEGNCGNSSDIVASSNCLRNNIGIPLKNGSYKNHEGFTAKIYSMSLMVDPATATLIFNDGLSAPTQGEFIASTSIGEMDTIFETLKYAILKEVLLNKVNRYGIDLN